MIDITDTQKIGVGLAGFGMTFLFLGVLLLFDKGLLAIGNLRLSRPEFIILTFSELSCRGPEELVDPDVHRQPSKMTSTSIVETSGSTSSSGPRQLSPDNILFISGLACVIGLQRTFFFFFQRHKVKATVAFFGGISIVLLGWPMIGMIAEMYGFLLLFRGFLPAAVNFLRMVPVLGSLLSLPIIRGIVDRIAGDNGRNMV